MTPSDKQTILVVDDELSWQTMLTDLCRSAGFQVVQAFDAQAACHQIDSSVSRPILAIVDLNLQSSALEQEYAGLQLLTTLRDRDMYTIVVSGNIPAVQDVLIGRAEIRQLVDKTHFAMAGAFGREVFLPWVREAAAYAQAARQAEGLLPEQQQRLQALDVPPDALP